MLRLFLDRTRGGDTVLASVLVLHGSLLLVDVVVVVFIVSIKVGLDGLGRLSSLAADARGGRLLDLGGGGVGGCAAAAVVLLGGAASGGGGAVVDAELALDLSETNLLNVQGKAIACQSLVSHVGGKVQGVCMCVA